MTTNASGPAAGAAGNSLLVSWLLEPVGVLVPLIATVLLLFAPQSADMFAGMQYGQTDGRFDNAWYHPTGLLAGAFVLGWMAWYWTRAVLLANIQVADWDRSPGRPDPVTLPPELETAPRLALVFTGLICAAPLAPAVPELFSALLHWRRPELGPLFESVPIGMVAGSVAVVLALALLVIYRRRLRLLFGQKPPSWGWALRSTSLFIAAPFGWGLAILMMAVSCGWAVLLVVRPDLIERGLHTPTAALLSLGAVIGPLTWASCLFRDVVALVLVLPFGIGRLFAARGATPRPSVWASARAASRIPGLALFAVWLVALPAIVSAIPIVPASVAEDAARYRVRMLEPLAPAPECAQIGTASPANPPATSGRDQRPCLEQAVLAWRQARLDLGYPADRKMPMIIVTAEGGASRAAVWLLSALRLLDGETAGLSGQYLFAISGVSGGSLGAATYLLALTAAAPDKPTAANAALPWSDPRMRNGLRELARGDLLAVSVSDYFLNDVLAHVLAGAWPESAPDRGVALEQEFERHWMWSDGFAVPEQLARGPGLVGLWHAAPPGAPHLFLNGTNAETGWRTITSTVRFGPQDDLFAASVDFFRDVGRNIPLSTAVLNSARFPFVSPAGRFASLDHDGTPASERQIIDGGYFENYGATTAAELIWQIRMISDRHALNLLPLVVVVSDDGEGDRTKTGDDAHSLERISTSCATSETHPVPKDVAEAIGQHSSGNMLEFLAPLVGLNSVRGAHSLDALHVLRRLQCGALQDKPDAPPSAALGRMIHIALAKPAADEAAPMNWVLSPLACNYLLNVAPVVRFNLDQAASLRLALAEATGQQIEGHAPPAIDCFAAADPRK